MHASFIRPCFIFWNEPCISANASQPCDPPLPIQATLTLLTLEEDEMRIPRRTPGKRKSSDDVEAPPDYSAAVANGDVDSPFSVNRG